MLTSADIDARIEGLTVPGMFLRTLRDHPDQVLLRWKDDEGE
jgi:hypothetical protein